MRTTMILSDPLFALAQQAAVEAGLPFRAIVEEALRAFLLKRQDVAAGSTTASEWPVISYARPHPDVDLNCTSALLDLE